MGWGGECVTPVLVRSLKLSTLVHSQFLDWCPRVRFPYSTQTRGFKNNWSRHLVKQLWPPDGCRRTEGRLSTTLVAKGCGLSTQQERSFKWIDPCEESKGGKADCAWGYPIRAYKWLGAMSVKFFCPLAPGPHSRISEEFLPSIILRPKKQLESYQPYSPYECSVDGWMCCPKIIYI